MPSIPQSLLWISLVVLWLFVLVPMLISKRDAVRRTSDVALATRVLTSGTSARLLKRGGPAAGHRSDPAWRREHHAGHDDEHLDDEASVGSVLVAAAVEEQTGLDYLDVDVVDEDSGALPVGAGAADAELSGADEADDGLDDGLEDEYCTDEFDEEDAPDPAAEADAGEYEYVEDTSGLEDDGGAPARPAGGARGAARRRGYDPKTAAAVSARKYGFRTRVLMSMSLVLVVSALAAFTVAPSAWWLCAGASCVTLLYLAYLRRQTRIEEQVRIRRARRMARAQRGVDDAGDRAFDVVSSRLRRPGAAVLDIDDEDPAFEHLEYAAYARDHDWRRDLPRAAGQ